MAEFLQVVRYGQTSLSVAWCERDLEQAKENLARAFHARDEARAHLRITEHQHSIPAYLLKDPA
jgi:hypothetical protein